MNKYRDAKRMVAFLVCGGVLLAASAFGALITDGLQLRYQSEDWAIATSQVGTWNNSGDAGDDGDLVQLSTAARPEITDNAVNGKDAASFDGADLLRVTDNATLSSALDVSANDGMTFFSVVRFGSLGGTQFVINPIYSGNSPLKILTVGSTLYAQSRTSGGAAQNSSATVSADEWMVIAGVWNGAADTVQLWVNGEAQTAATAASVTISGTDFTQLDIGNTGYDGEMAEILIYNKALNSTEMADNFDALNSTYAIPEPATLGLFALALGALTYRRRIRRPFQGR